MHGPRIAFVLATLAGAIGLAATAQGSVTRTNHGCPVPRGSEHVRLDPRDFSTRIDNPYWRMSPGSRWVYRETDASGGRQRDVVTVTHTTKLIANGITARIVHDAATENGVPVEVTDDLYAQDRCGNIWYLGEATREYENGKVVSTEGSFEAGVDGAEPGVILLARPTVGLRYRQEHYPGHAEDRAEVSSRADRVQVPYGYFAPGRVLTTHELNPLEPRSLELKFYARGIGPVLAVAISGGTDREELVSYRKGG